MAAIILAAGPAFADDAPVITQNPVGGNLVAGMNLVLTVTATGTGPLTYQWQKDGQTPFGNPTSSNIVLTRVSPADAGSYTVTVTNSAGSVTSAPAVVTVSTAPVLSATNPISGTTGFNKITFRVYAYGSFPTFTWYRGGLVLQSGGGLYDPILGYYSDLLIYSPTSESQGYYSCVVSNADGSVISPTVTVPLVAEAPAITADLSGQTAYLGQPVTLAVSASGTLPITFQWYKDDAPIAGATASTYLIAAMQSGDAGRYRVTLANPFGSAASATAALSAAVPPLAFTAELADKTGELGQGIILGITAASVGTLSYQWYHDGQPVPNATHSTLTIESLQPGDRGEYSVTVSNGYVSATSRTATVDYTLPPLIPRQPAFPGVLVGLAPDYLPAGTIQWQVSSDNGATWQNLSEDLNYAGVTTAALEILHVTSAMNGDSYRYQFTAAGRTDASNATVLSVGSTPFLMPVGIVAGADSTIYVSDAAAQAVFLMGGSTPPALLAGTPEQMGSTDGAGLFARFNEPGGLALDPDGSLLLADTGNSTVRKITLPPMVTTFAGAAGVTGGTEGTGATVRLNSPTGITRDPAGNCYIADQMNHVIRIISPAGVSATMAGKAGIAGSVDSLGASALFNRPTGIAIDAQGNLYVSDQGSHVIRKMTPAGQVTTIAGQAGQPGSDDGPAANARFNRPTGLAWDRAGNLYVADTGNSTIRKIIGGIVTTVAGSPGLTALKDGQGADAWFNEPEGLAFDAAQSLFVADTGNAAIRKISATGEVTTLSWSNDAPGITTQPASLVVSATPISNPPPPASSGGGGGGAIEVWFAAALLVLGLGHRLSVRLPR
ncbi:MAG TPA: immunoglobulin domain-containing protein [Lacunisphaera sp.]|nr:immunoglobulin domain-containing protein [Lacunisphaera sp.]